MAVNWTDPDEVQQFRQDALSKGFDQSQVDSYVGQHTQTNVPSMSQSMPNLQQTPQVQRGILPTTAPITQHEGNYNPNVEIYSGGYARDTNFAVPVGTTTALPPGKWRVQSVYSGAPVAGGPRGQNQGYGNMVKVVNEQTGDSMIYQHLAKTNAQTGQELGGGNIIGTSGASGNVTGANLGIEYADKTGRLRDITQSPYAQYLFGGSQ